MIRPLPMLPLMLALAACSVETAAPQTAATPTLQAASSMPAPKERAQAAAKDFSATLKAALTQRLAVEGTEGAIAFCKTEAPKIAGRVAREHGVRIGRVPVAGRQRSPTNTPEPWQSEGLASFQARKETGTPIPELVRVADTDLPEGVALRMMRGIAVEPMCLACHGKTLAPSTRAALQRFYPDDAATGFDAGDLRGALWVEVPAAP